MARLFKDEFLPANIEKHVRSFSVYSFQRVREAKPTEI